MKRILVMVMVVSLFLLVIPTAALAQNKTIYNSPYPDVIRVAIREARPDGEPNPWGRIIYVKSMPFDEYIFDSLPNEWVPSWNTEALQAGAMAVKMFAWYHVLYPTTLDGWEYDVDNTTNFQTYREGNRFEEANQAHLRVRPLAFTDPDGTIVELNYRSGYQGGPNWEYRNANMMSQWGTQYLATEEGRDMLGILQWFYEGRTLMRIPNL